MQGLTLLLGALLSSACFAFPSGQHGLGGSKGGKAVYFLRVDPAGGSVVAIDVGGKGKLKDRTSVTSTNGMGLQSQNATDPDLAPVPFDPLQGQSSVVVSDDYLFTVNSGSNTAVMFEIDPTDPLKLTSRSFACKKSLDRNADDAF
ncbi:uncharacterized protein LTR77_001514 [Saxophila tyrrhenica]|uniref:3-carboxymuconate cyclase n=1 Tax=Saxophila tyrrhenica TaxID=1690608 RepID=A0AAV9PLQ2_9PEZI|nr:hypothetical protein LTR77_001514 [Saxophila tyrrhenica]